MSPTSRLGEWIATRSGATPAYNETTPHGKLAV
jgi:hypothetical protein